MGFISWIIIGGLAGYIASIFMKTEEKMGKIANTAAGVVGGTAANYVLGRFGIAGLDGFGIQSLVVCIIGAAVVIGIVKVIKK